MASSRIGASVDSCLRNPAPHQRDAEHPRRGWRMAVIAVLALLLPGCGGPPERAVKDAKAGDLLVRSAQTRVALVAPFQPGVANGLYKGVIRVTQADGANRLYRINAVCSMKNEPGWPTYDNLFADPITDVKQASTLGASPDRWQIFYYFDGRVEANRKVIPEPWMVRLKDNLCRRDDFDDSARTGSSSL
jgi:hypothetical protein